MRAGRGNMQLEIRRFMGTEYQHIEIFQTVSGKFGDYFWGSLLHRDRCCKMKTTKSEWGVILSENIENYAPLKYNVNCIAVIKMNIKETAKEWKNAVKL